MESVETTQVFFVVREGGRGPGLDPESALIASAIGAGFSFADGEALLDSISKDPETGLVVRKTVWAIKDSPVEIDGERVTFREFKERFESEAWILANRHSTIGRLFWATNGLHEMHQTLFVKRPCVVVRNGSLWALIPPDATEEEAAALIRQIY